MNTKVMKNLIKILPALLIVACSGPKIDGTLAELEEKRDSLQKKQAKIEIQLNKIDYSIAALDSTINPDDIKIIKKITAQKNKIVKLEEKIKDLENEMTERDNKKLIPVTVKEINPDTFKHYIQTFGEVEAKNYARISPEMAGRIEKIYVTPGQQVKKGQLLVSLNSDAIEKQIQGVKSSLEFALKTFNKQNTLWKQGIGSEIEYLSAKNTKESLEAQLESLQAQKRMTQIKAPFDGYVNDVFPKEGEIASPSFPVIEFVNLSHLIVTADISEKYINDITKGKMVELTFSSLPGYKLSIPVKRVSKVINSASRTFEIELLFDNPANKIKPNMVSTIEINDFFADDAFVVPSLAINKDITGKYVYIVAMKNNEFIVEKKYITPGLSYEDQTMIEDGLKKGDKVVVKGYHLVSTGVPVNVVE